MASPHGTRKRYLAGCGCEKCCRAHTNKQREYRWSRLEKLVAKGDIIYVYGRRINVNEECPHGTNTAYGYWWCQCQKCTTEHTKRCKERANKRKTT